MRTTDKMERTKETIDNWLMSRGYPREFQLFFFHWTLLNLYYNELSKEKAEVKRVLKFGREYERLFDGVKTETRDLIKTECVGEGEGPVPPNRWVKTASSQLRKSLKVDESSICAECRTSKRKKCKTIKLKTHNFKRMEALMRILYQVRCNLFHGDKTEHTDGEQARRNRLLVKVGNNVLEKILRSID